jgi:hypothetical protein
MQFDPAIAAQRSLARAVESGELAEDLELVIATEEAFSAEAGDAARSAYHALQQIGERHPGARAFQEFLIYITWQQVTEETIPLHFRTGLALCDRYLRGCPASEAGDARSRVGQIRELRASFRRGLGLDEDDEMEEFDKDAFHGGD